MFTALHRAAGVEPGPLTNEILNAAIESGAKEAVDLDWKSQLPPTKNLRDSDFPKDIAAMANAGGGVIVYGVEESQKVATIRKDVGELTEVHERSLHVAAINAITPPVFGLTILKLGDGDSRAVAVIIPPSSDGPHLVFKSELFGAPIRNDADTVWMQERQIEAAYRARFDDRRYSADALYQIFEETSAGRDIEQRAWLIAAARPRIPRTGVKLTRDEARNVFKETEKLALVYADRASVHPLESVDTLNPRPGLRRWVAVNTATHENAKWKEAWASVHHDGSVSVAAAVGGHRSTATESLPGSKVQSAGIESAVADFMALLRSTSAETGSSEYEIRIAIQWAGKEPLKILTTSNGGYLYEDASTPLHYYAPVQATVNAQSSSKDFYASMYEIARDCLNQGGISTLQKITHPDHVSS